MYLSDDAPLGPRGLLYALFFPADSTELQSCFACFDLGIEPGVKGPMQWSLTVGHGVKALLLRLCKHAVSFGSSLAATLREGGGVAASVRGAADESGLNREASVEVSGSAAAGPAERCEEVLGA